MITSNLSISDCSNQATADCVLHLPEGSVAARQPAVLRVDSPALFCLAALERLSDLLERSANARLPRRGGREDRAQRPDRLQPQSNPSE